jgi:hypothetical protein
VRGRNVLRAATVGYKRLRAGYKRLQGATKDHKRVWDTEGDRKGLHRVMGGCGGPLSFKNGQTS